MYVAVHVNSTGIVVQCVHANFGPLYSTGTAQCYLAMKNIFAHLQHQVTNAVQRMSLGTASRSHWFLTRSISHQMSSLKSSSHTRRFLGYLGCYEIELNILLHDTPLQKFFINLDRPEFGTIYPKFWQLH